MCDLLGVTLYKGGEIAVGLNVTSSIFQTGVLINCITIVSFTGSGLECSLSLRSTLKSLINNQSEFG